MFEAEHKALVCCIKQTNTHTHTHTHIYIYIYIYIYIHKYLTNTHSKPLPCLKAVKSSVSWHCPPDATEWWPGESGKLH